MTIASYLANFHRSGSKLPNYIVAAGDINQFKNRLDNYIGI